MNFKSLFNLSLILFLLSCSTQTPKTTEQASKNQDKDAISEKNEAEKALKKDSVTPPRKGLEFLVDVQSLDPAILVDLKYATEDNFMKKRLYFDLNKLYLQKDVAERLVKVQLQLKKLRPELTLLLYDGVRPLSVQWEMWKALDSIPVKERVKFVSNPANGSLHNYGAAIDLTIAELNGTPLDMGAGYDDIREIAYPKHEARYLQSGELTTAQIENRKLLRAVMKSQGFRNIPTEWWHFNACTREQAKKKYTLLQ